MNKYSKRSYTIISIFVLVAFIFIIGLFRLQMLDPAYKVYATNNVLREITQYPARGLIFDRNGKLLVHNKPSYDLLITPREVGVFDTLYICKLLEITKADLETRIQAARKYSWYRPSILVKQISPETYAILQEKIYRFKGFHTQSRTLREYNFPVAAHVLGYVGEVNAADLERDTYYSMGDYIGVTGIEKTYEKWLRGEKGTKKFLVDVHNRIQGSFLDGGEDSPAKVGYNLTSSIDVDLQLYAEELLQNKKGSIVAIEPSTGEILAIASAPGYHPNLLVGRQRGTNYSKLLTDTLKPLFNRALLSEYPPGSTFKVINALIALEEGSITEHTRFSCAGRGSTPIRCTHSHISPLTVADAIKESCNPFLWNTYRSILAHYPTTAEGYRVWRDYVQRFGLGNKLGLDLPVESRGSLPDDNYFDLIYGKGRWRPLTVRSMAIGQGELGVTPVQLANYTAAIANRGYYFTPHVVKDIENAQIDNIYKIKHSTGISEKHFEPIIDGMHRSIEYSSSGALIKVPEVVMCGKTGTVQNNHGSDHSVFMAFAPKDDPKIAISVYIENGVWGARYAAPIASLMVEKYLNDSISPGRKWVEKRMIDANLLNPNQPK
ncbi:MAG TPA: penicillin-binding protein 2 [Mariniphaga sp.]|nr:penicillin-binding protein 2 [Mariniphaga sp.]